MNELNNLLLTLITENQTQKIKAEKFAEMTQRYLGDDWIIINIEKYQKFKNSYKIELICVINGKQQNELNNLAISLTDRLVSPWLVYFDKDKNSIELIFNKDENTRKSEVEFNVIKWGNLQIMK